MAGDLIIFAPHALKVDFVKNRLDLSALSFDELVTELVVGQFIVLGTSPQLQYLRIEKADAIGFIANLRLRVAQARREGFSRLTSQDQLYDLEIRSESKSLSLRDAAQVGAPTLHLTSVGFSKSVDECAAGLFYILLLLFPKLATRKDIDRVRDLLGVMKRHQT